MFWPRWRLIVFSAKQIGFDNFFRHLLNFRMFELAIETSGRIGSAALAVDGKIAQLIELSGFMRHSAELWLAVEQLLSDIGANRIDAVYGAIGPGSFTGIRIAVTFMKMMGFAVGCRVVAVDTLDAIAQRATNWLCQHDAGLRRVLAVIDAKQGRFFVSIYDIKDGKWVKITPSQLVYPPVILDKICSEKIETGVCGEGLVYYADRFQSPLTRVLDQQTWRPTAADVYWAGRRQAEKGQFADIYTLAPNYIRLPDAVEKRQASCE